MPPIDRMGLIIEAYDSTGSRVFPAFELEDLRKPIFLDKDGEITVDKPISTKYNTPIGYISSRNNIMLDLSNVVNKYATAVTKT